MPLKISAVFGCTRGLVVMDWSAPAVLVGGGEEEASSSVLV